jgi:hypothetical protein
MERTPIFNRRFHHSATHLPLLSESGSYSSFGQKKTALLIGRDSTDAIIEWLSLGRVKLILAS